MRANQLKDDLTSLTANLGLAIIEGNKVVEIKNAIINKGSEEAPRLRGRPRFDHARLFAFRQFPLLRFAAEEKRDVDLKQLFDR